MSCATSSLSTPPTAIHTGIRQSAILEVVTIKLHQDTLAQLLEAKIHSSQASPDDKKKLIDQLRSLPADAIRRLTMKLLDMGLDKLPDVFQLLQKALLDAIR